MPYHGNCCVCALTLGLTIFGSMSTSTGVCLLLNYQMYGGNSTSPRTLPSGDWAMTAGIAISTVGLLMFLSGICLILCCLTAGVSLTCRKKSAKNYKVFDNEVEDPAEESQTTEKTSGGPDDVSEVKSVSVADCAYDVAFIDEDRAGKCALETSSQREAGKDHIPKQPVTLVPTTQNVTNTNASHGCEAAEPDTGFEPRICYPSVNLEASGTYTDLRTDGPLLL